MTPDQIQKYKDTLKAGKFDPDKRVTQYEFQRGWNSALEFAEAYLDATLKPKAET